MAERNGAQVSDTDRPPAVAMFAKQFDSLIDRIKKNRRATVTVISKLLKAHGVPKGASAPMLSRIRKGELLPGEDLLLAVCDLANVDRAERLELLRLLQKAREARKIKAQAPSEPTSQTPDIKVRAPFLPRSTQKPELVKPGPHSLLARGRSQGWLMLIMVCALLIAPEPELLPSGQNHLPATSGCSMGERIPLVKTQGAAARMPEVYLRACVELLDGNRVQGVLRVEYIDGESYEAKVNWRIELRSCSNRKEAIGPPNAGEQERFHNESPFTRTTEPVGWNSGVRAKAKLIGISVRDAAGAQWVSLDEVITETPQCSRPPTPSTTPAEPSVRPEGVR